jgi:hypothetical protein
MTVLIAVTSQAEYGLIVGKYYCNTLEKAKRLAYSKVKTKIAKLEVPGK